ncbi:MAG: DUF5685 family protein [Lachnospiraceae bacterium]|nr:DUF5685 family protein [Lachnospiraceae bacterium]
MFGYVTVNKEELKLKDFQRYQGYYCGVCQELKERYGQTGRMTLTFDMTFLAILLSGLYEDTTKEEMRFCGVHPTKKHLCLRNEFTAYGAAMNILSAYYNLLDDWQDEHSYKSYTAAKLLRRSFKKVEAQYPRQTQAMKNYLKKIHACEQENSKDLDLAAGLTGELLGELYVYKEDIWSEDLRALGFFIGKFIYLMDAYEDRKKDEKTGNYNPLLFLEGSPDFDKTVESILTMMMAEAAKAFEKLPIIENVDILRNILYIGIWVKYDHAKKKAEGKQEK